MARKKPEPKPVPEVEAEGQIEPVEPKKKKPIVGRALVKLNPEKEWSEGLSTAEVEKWESVAETCRTGIKPLAAADAVGARSSWCEHQRKRDGLSRYIISAYGEGCRMLLSKIAAAQSWQAQAWMLERQMPEEYALDSSIRQAVLGWAQESGMDVADLNDLIRLVKLCAEKEIDLGAFVTEELAKREALELAS